MNSSNNKKINLVGILNLTPDSFSDGGNFLAVEQAIAHANHLLHSGAQIIDIGGDSTRPGSKCVGIEQEWQRVEAIIDNLKDKCCLSIDTHHSEVARRAVSRGVQIINDVSGGYDPEMLPFVAASKTKVVLTHTRCPQPHVFPEINYQHPAREILTALKGLVERAAAQGVQEDQIVLDPGMGAFLSSRPEVSIQVLAGLQSVFDLGYPVMLGISRKGFLKKEAELSIAERDLASARHALDVCLNNTFLQPLYLRVHDVGLHKEVLGHDFAHCF